jgi:hypothetical protein
MRRHPAFQKRKPSCLRAHVIRSHIMGPCSRCQKRPPAPRGSQYQVRPLNRPLWRTRGWRYQEPFPSALSLQQACVSRLGPPWYFPVCPAISCGW